MSEARRSSFYWAMRLMAPERREAMYAIYAFCRVVDDIADCNGLTPAERLFRLGLWRLEIEKLYGGTATKPIAKDLTDPVAQFGLEKADFLAVIDGCEMDACGRMLRPPLAVLDLYCDRVASAVGRLSVRVFGDFRPAGMRVANSLGRALQLTNILRDVEEDAERGRLYLPDEVLSAHGILGTDLPAILAHPALPKVRHDLVLLARGHYGAARNAMNECSRRAMRPAALMGAIYASVLDRIESGRSTQVPTPIKLWYALRYGLM